MKRILKKVLFALLAFFLVILLLELIAKLVIATKLKNKIDPATTATEFEEIYVPPFETKEADDFWIFVYGGSTVQGIPLPKTGFVPQLQYQANKVFEGKNIKVFNLGWAGFNSTRIRYLLERTIDQKPDLVLVYTGENEFIYPQLDFYWLVRSVTAAKNRTDIGKLIMYATKSKSAAAEEFASRDQKFPAYSENDLLVFLKKRIFETNMKAITKTTREAGVPLILGIPAHNISDWPPVRRQLTTAKIQQGYTQALQKVSDLTKSDNLDEAVPLVDEYLLEFKDDASLLFAKGTIEKKLKRDSKQIFERALDNDPVPWRTTTQEREFLISLADEKTVWVIDFGQVLSRNSKDGLVGFDFILDGTHPTKEGAYFISRHITDFLKEKQLVNRAWMEEAKSPYEISDLMRIMGISEEDDFTVYLKTAQLSLKIPLMNLSGAKFYLKKAQDIDGQNWETKATLAVAAHLQGDDRLAGSYLAEAEELKKSKITKEEVKHIPYLSEILTP